MPKYCFRAECIDDIICLRKSAKQSNVEIESLTVTFDDDLPDVMATFKSDANSKDIETVFRDIEDGHVMLESLDLANRYTGERACQRSWLIHHGNDLKS